MDYNSFSKEELIQIIKELQMLNQQLLKEKEEEVGLDFAWTGNLGHWYWNIKTNTVTFNPLKVTTLGYSKEEIPEKVDYEFFTDKLHPEDYQKTMDVMLQHLQGKLPIYEIEYRIRTKDGKYKWYYDRGKITQYDDEGKPTFIAGIVFDITERKQMHENLKVKNKILKEKVIKDGLTNIKNHRALKEELKLEMERALRLKNPLSIVIFDIDYFKKINDTKGHVYGDKVLIKVAEIMESHIRKIDVVGRYGGEEFMIIFKNTGESVARLIAENIRCAIESHFSDKDMKVTISGGIHQYCGERIQDFINMADMNLYRAKKLGRNRIV